MRILFTDTRDGFSIRDPSKAITVWLLVGHCGFLACRRTIVGTFGPRASLNDR